MSKPARKNEMDSRLRRIVGMSADKLAAMHAANDKELWWARCWNCRRQVTLPKVAISHADCPHCGVKLGSRE